MTHKTRALSLSLVLALASVGGLAAASEAPGADVDATGERCSNRSLVGTYLFEYLARPAGGADLAVAVGFRYFDGRGAGRLSYTTAAGRTARTRFRYDVEPDCTGTVEYASGFGAEDIFVHPRGQHFAWIDTRPGFAASGQDWLSSRRAPNGCSNATLRGTFSYGVRGTADPGAPPPSGFFAEAGLESFDGNGKLWNRFRDSNGETGVVTGSYRIGSNCIGRMTYATGETYRVYVSPSGDAVMNITIDPDDVRRYGSEHKISDRLLVTDD
jgi:hypothetical protein